MSDWQLDGLPGDVRQEAENAAQREGLPLHRWLGKLIRESCDAEGVSTSRELMHGGASGNGNGQRSQSVVAPRPQGEPIRTAPQAPQRPTAAPMVARQTDPSRQPNRVPPATPPVPPAPATPPAPAANGRSDDRLAALGKLVQSLRRNELSPIGEARLFLKLMTEHMASIGDITAVTGRTKEQISRSLRLLGLSDRLRDLIDRGALSREQAFALLDADDPDTANPVVPPSGSRA